MQSKPPSFDPLLVRAAPALFIVLWSSGFIGAKYGLPYAEPLTFLALRMMGAVVLLAAILWIRRPPLPSRARIGHSVATGLMMHGCYLGGVFIAIRHGLPTGLAALIVSMQPVLTSTVAGRVLGERVTPPQWAGLALGLAGVGLVVHDKLGTGTSEPVAWFAISAALLGITGGTLYQKRFGGGMDWRPQLLIQYTTAGILFGVGAVLFETRSVTWNRDFVFALAWLVFVVSLAAVWLFYFLLARISTARMTSLLYMMPPTTALMGWVLFGERLPALSLAGMAACVAAVFLVHRRSTGPVTSAKRK